MVKIGLIHSSYNPAITSKIAYAYPHAETIQQYVREFLRMMRGRAPSRRGRGTGSISTSSYEEEVSL